MKKIVSILLISLFVINIYGQSIGTYANPGQSAAHILAINPSANDSIYWIDTDGDGGNEPFQAFCDMTTDGGGWVLVLLSNSSVTYCPRPYWSEVIDSVNYNGTLSTDLTSFDLFLGVNYWNALGTEMRLDMGNTPSSLSHRAYYDFNLDESNNYALSMSNEVISIHTEGTNQPGMFTYHNGRQLTTRDSDHDAWSGNCSSNYHESAWWYGACMSGSFWGGGGESYQDAPYWTDSASEYFEYGSIWIRGTWTPTSANVSTNNVNDITYTTAIVNAEITDLGNSNVTAYGVCWNETGTPTISDNITNEGVADSVGVFSSQINNLLPNTTYYVRAYATNFSGTAYGDEVTFTTSEDNTPPNVITKDTSIYINDSGVLTIDVSFINDGTNDDYHIDTMYLNNYIFDCSNIGDNIVWLYAEDDFGNIDSSFAIITVIDTIAPVLIAQDFTLQLDSTGNAILNVTDIVTSATDNCIIADTTLSQTVFDCSDNNSVIGVDVILTDVSGNSITETVSVTISNSDNPVFVETASETICNGETYLFGTQNLTTAGQYIEIFQSQLGCDSVVTLTLDVDTINVSVTVNGSTLSANIIGASYQWVDCNDNNNPISGETNQNFTATVDGSYAVVIDDGICIDTSICYTITNVGTTKLNNDLSIVIYPNPATDYIQIEINLNYNEQVSAKLLDITGKLLIQKYFTNETKFDTKLLNEGVYILMIETERDIVTKKIIIK